MPKTWVTDYIGDIGNTFLYRRHRQHFCLKWVFDRLEPAGLVIELAEIILHETDESDSVRDLFDDDRKIRANFLLLGRASHSCVFSL